jgi:hypothetical protein
MNIQFYINKPDNPKSVIMISITDKSDRLRIGTRVSVIPKDWSEAKKKLKASASNSSRLVYLYFFVIVFGVGDESERAQRPQIFPKVCEDRSAGSNK